MINPLDFMKNIKNLQSKMEEVQSSLKTLRSEGSSGGGLVKVTVDGSMEAVSVTLDPIAVDPRDVKMLEELTAAAFTDAVRKMKPVMESHMAKFSGSFNIPPDILDKT